MTWLLCIAGIIFCLTGIYYFRKNVFEEDRTIRPAVLIMIMGVILIALGTVRFFKILQ